MCECLKRVWVFATVIGVVAFEPRRGIGEGVGVVQVAVRGLGRCCCDAASETALNDRCERSRIGAMHARPPPTREMVLVRGCIGIS